MSFQEQSSAVVEWVDASLLKAHPKNEAIYGTDGFQDLVESIRELGVLQAIYARPDNVVISGHRRWRAALECGKPVPVIRVKYPNSLDELQAIIEHNRYRIKNGQQLYNEGKELEGIEAERNAAKVKQPDFHGNQYTGGSVENLPPEQKTKTRDKVAKTIGLGSGKQWDKLSYVAEHEPSLLVKINPDGMTIHKAYKDTKEAVIKAESDARLAVLREQTSLVKDFPCRLYNASLTDVDLAPESIDAIVTDPPWTDTSMDTYRQLAELAQHVLKPGGSVLAMVGHAFLPEAIKLMERYLKYWWMIAYMLPGENRRYFSHKVFNQWKIVLWFVKGEYSSKFVSDVCSSEQREKRFHAWQSSESGFQAMVEAITEPGELVLDPFMGSGATGVACLNSGRDFIGIELNTGTFNNAKARLWDEYNKQTKI